MWLYMIIVGYYTGLDECDVIEKYLFIIPDLVELYTATSSVILADFYSVIFICIAHFYLHKNMILIEIKFIHIKCHNNTS